MELDRAAKCLSELGNPTRLEVFRLLVRAGDSGMTVGGIQKHLNVPASTLSHHLSHLVWAGLIIQERDGRTLHCRTQPGVMNELVGFLMDECCKGFDSETNEQEVKTAI